MLPTPDPSTGLFPIVAVTNPTYVFASDKVTFPTICVFDPASKVTLPAAGDRLPTTVTRPMKLAPAGIAAPIVVVVKPINVLESLKVKFPFKATGLVIDVYERIGTLKNS